MIDSSQLTEAAIAPKYDAMPDELRAVFDSPQTEESIKEIARNIGMSDDETVEILEQTAAFVLIGILSPAALPAQLMEALATDDERLVKEVTIEMIDKIFKPVARFLEKMYPDFSRQRQEASISSPEHLASDEQIEKFFSSLSPQTSAPLPGSGLADFSPAAAAAAATATEMNATGTNADKISGASDVSRATPAATDGPIVLHTEEDVKPLMTEALSSFTMPAGGDEASLGMMSDVSQADAPPLPAQIQMGNIPLPVSPQWSEKPPLGSRAESAATPMIPETKFRTEFMKDITPELPVTSPTSVLPPVPETPNLSFFAPLTPAAKKEEESNPNDAVLSDISEVSDASAAPAAPIKKSNFFGSLVKKIVPPSSLLGSKIPEIFSATRRQQDEAVSLGADPNAKVVNYTDLPPAPGPTPAPSPTPETNLPKPSPLDDAPMPIENIAPPPPPPSVTP